MLIEQNRILCDLTGAILDGDFIYYSVVGRKIHHENGKVNPSRDIMVDLDLCDAAYKQIIERCRPNIGSPIFAGNMKCELSGKDLSGVFDYVHLVFDKVSVMTSKADPKTGDVPVEIVNGILDLNICLPEAEALLDTQRTCRKTPTL